MSVNRYFNITDDYRVTSDKYQYFILKKRVVVDKESKNFGETFWDTEAYLPKIEDVMKYFLERGIKDDIGNINAIAAWVNEIESKFTEFLKVERGRKGLK